MWQPLLSILRELKYRLTSMRRIRYNDVMSDEWRLRKELYPNEYE